MAATVDVAAEAEGASVVAASSFDTRHPPEHMLDGKDGTFWSTTGGYPQEVVIRLSPQSSSVGIQTIVTVTTNVRRLELEKSQGPGASRWEPIFSTTLDDADGDAQTHSASVRGVDSSHIRLRITSGWAEVASVHRLAVLGRVGQRQSSFRD